jgi:transcriptional regulator GlxA family with amidase domain
MTVDAGPGHRVAAAPALADDRLRAIAALLRADPADERTLAELGMVADTSERPLSRLFRPEAGMSAE